MIQEDNARRLATIDDLAASLGARPGQTVADALALCPLLTIVDAEPEVDARALEALADWCTRFSPAVAVDAPDGLFLDIDGCAHLWGGEADLAAALLERLGAQNIPARLAIADTFGAAWALARYSECEVAIAEGDERARLSAFPVAALRVGTEISASLSRLGLKTIGDLETLPRGALHKRFGAALLWRRDCAYGAEEEALRFRYPSAPWSERAVFAEPISAPDSLARVLSDLAAALCARLDEEGYGARRFEAVYHRVDGGAARRVVETALPVRDVKRLAKLFAPKLETLDPGFGIEIVTLQANSIAPLKPEQTDVEHVSASARAIDLAPLIDRLRNTFGEDRVWRMAVQESHVPERATIPIEPLAAPTGRAWDPDKPRPIRLFRHPQPIDVTALIPDDPPILFRWRGQIHRIRRAEGPERIGAEWWRKPWAENEIDRVRDYYCVEDEAGARFWVFRTGLYGGARPTRWFLHGLFRMNAPAYAELQVTSNFSFLRGGSHAAELVATAKALGLSAIAITDRNTLSGIVRGHVAAQEAGLRFLVGARLDFSDGAPSVLCFPVDRAAYGRLTKLLSRGQLRTTKGECDLRYGDLIDAADPSNRFGDGQIFIAIAPAQLNDEFTRDLARVAADFPNSTYLAATRLYGAQDVKRLHRLADLARQTGAPLVATGDVLYHTPARRALQDVLTCIREKCTLDQAGLRLEANGERHIKTPAEMQRLFTAYPGAIARTTEIAERCRFSLTELRYEYPDEPVPPGKTPQQHLVDLTWEGAAKRYPGGVPADVKATLEKELAFIAEKEIPQYFLTVHDIVRWAREGEKEPGKRTEILCQGRGSAANSAVCFCLGVTAVNPTETKLLFERFLSKERSEPPDIDVDFEHERREEVIQYIYKRYGRERAAICATVIHYRARSAIRDVGKALGLTDDVTAALANTVWGSWGGKAREGEEPPEPTIPDPHIRQAGFDPNNPDIRRAIDLTSELLDFPRHLSQHVGGFVLTKHRLDETVPIGNAAMVERTFIEWDKDDIDALGLMKVDVLALGMLTCIRRALTLLEEQRGIVINDIADIEHDDAVYAMLSKGNSVGVFQVESRAQMSMLPRLRPTKFYDLVIEVAIVRPGPIQGGMVHPYLKRRAGEAVVYPSPSPEHGPRDELKTILERTLGVPLFQEQAMAIALTAAKFSAEETNGLRRAMATFRSDGTMYKYRDKFISRMIARGYDPEFAKNCYKQIEGFGSYGFPESHAASFAKLVYVSSWLKYKYPDVFCAAILNSQPMGFYQPAQLVRDAREHGVEVRAPDVMASHWDCTLEESQSGPHEAVRLGLRLVDGLGAAEAAKLIEARQAGARSAEEIARRAGLARGVLERIAEADAFRLSGMDRRAALWRVSGLKDKRRIESEAPLLAGLDAPEEEATLPPMPLREHVVEDYRTTGLSLKAHPCQFFRRALSDSGARRSIDLLSDKLPSGRMVRVAGLVLNRQRPGTASGVMFATLEDETGIANLIVWPKIFERQRRLFMTSRFLLVQGRLQKAHGVTHVIVEHGTDLTPQLAKLQNAAAAGEDAPQLQRSRDFH